MFRLRELTPGETDHEVIWPMVSVGCALLAIAWLHFHLPIPRCGFHLATGLPCPACGATRCIVSLLHGGWRNAFGFNPVVFLTVACLAVFDGYAVVALTCTRKRLRVSAPGFFPPLALRLATVALIGLNWAYLIHRGDI